MEFTRYNVIELCRDLVQLGMGLDTLLAAGESLDNGPAEMSTGERCRYHEWVKSTTWQAWHTLSILNGSQVIGEQDEKFDAMKIWQTKVYSRGGAVASQSDEKDVSRDI